MVLNPDLYRVLVKHFGDVKVFNEGIQRLEERVPGNRKPIVHERGESYNVDCPLCGDEKQRLSISYQWLCKKQLSNERVTHLAHCYNEDCEVWKKDFWGQFIPDLDLAALGLLDDIEVSTKIVSARSQKGVIPMPTGCIPLHELDDDHRAIQWMLHNYEGLRTIKQIHYLSHSYGACFTEHWDPLFPPAQERVIFPITSEGKVVAWQGRTIEKGVNPRWFLPPGFVKVFYNLDRIGPYDIPVLNEGVLNAIFCGPMGTAMFGKQLNSIRAEELGSKCQAIILATDPDTYVPDNRKGGNGRIYVNELRDVLTEYIPDIRMLPWPKEVLDLATRHNNDEDVAVPDAADFGFKGMRELIQKVSD